MFITKSELFHIQTKCHIIDIGIGTNVIPVLSCNGRHSPDAMLDVIAIHNAIIYRRRHYHELALFEEKEELSKRRVELHKSIRFIDLKDIYIT